MTSSHSDESYYDVMLMWS